MTGTLRYRTDISEDIVTEDRDERAARLLLRALDSLAERDRALVLRTLLRRHVLSPGLGGSSGGGEPLGPGAEVTLGAPDVRQMEQPLLVRLPSDLHRRLRGWSGSHGFSMAGVVRGLVERFLDEQEGTPGGTGGSPSRR
jgi:hypothetical protein